MQKKSACHCASFSLRAVLALLFCVAACLVLTGTLLAFFRSETPTNVSQRTLTFTERVAYQRAIENVYWRHRIWPEGRRDAKPSLDAVMSQAQLEKKVADYLRSSQALQDYWQRPITAKQLQAEMDRMAKHSKQPEVLREIFAALGYDSFVIADCLARPALADRLLRNWYCHDERIHGELKNRAEADLLAHPAVEQMKQTSGKYSEIELARSDNPGEKATRDSAHTVKLKSFEWGQTMHKLAATFHHRGAASQISDAVPIGVLSPLQEEETSYYATAVIAKSDDHLKLGTITWHKEPLESWLARAEKQPAMTVAAGASYSLPKISDMADSCIDDTWTALPGPPDGRIEHTAVWTGSEMIVWGGYGYDDSPHYLNTGGRYNPDTDSWTPTSTANAPSSRTWHTAVWTGNEMIVWGGSDSFPNGFLNTGGRYNPGTDSWVATNSADAPEPRALHTAVWTGSNEMIVWGGSVVGSETNSGARYNPSTDSWTSTSPTNAPIARNQHTAVWTGSEMLVWGGADNQSYPYSDDGGRYDPATDSWAPISSGNTPAARLEHTAVWTGTEMIVWGGRVRYTSYSNTGGRYIPSIDDWLATSTTDAPSGRNLHTAIWTGAEMIVWGGDEGGFPLNTGARNNTRSAPSTPTPTPTPPIPATGGRYDPGTDTWRATSTTNAPNVRENHTAVWTGTEMIVWGGSWTDMYNHRFLFNSGGQYDPISDSWSGTGGSGVPDPRDSHSAVWTGTEMIVWGGDNGFGFVNTGGRYNPLTGIWTSTSLTNVPTGRHEHTAV